MILKQNNIEIPDKWKYDDYNGLLDKYYKECCVRY